MVAMQGSDAVLWDYIILLITIGAALWVWFFTIIGRDRKPLVQKRGEETIERYGDIEEDRAPVGKFLMWTYAGFAVWAIGYGIWVCTHGIF